MTRSLSLTGRVIAVVGAGGGGIGTAVAAAAAQAGASVVALSNDVAHLQELSEAAYFSAEADSDSSRLTTEVVDVADETHLRAALQRGADELGCIDGLVNVVGGVVPQYWHRLEEYPLASLDHLLTTNLRYALVSCQHVARQLIAAKQPGSLVNISSIASKGQPLLSGYGAAKAGLDSLGRSMASEWGRYGIRVNSVAPGTINTPRSGRKPDENDPATVAIPLRRRGTPDDVANAVLFLLSDLSSYISGQTLAVDGGPSRAGLDETGLPVFVTNPAIRERFANPAEDSP